MHQLYMCLYIHDVCVSIYRIYLSIQEGSDKLMNANKQYHSIYVLQHTRKKLMHAWTWTWTRMDLCAKEDELVSPLCTATHNK